jgi:hypothetical protein
MAGKEPFVVPVFFKDKKCNVLVSGKTMLQKDFIILVKVHIPEVPEVEIFVRYEKKSLNPHSSGKSLSFVPGNEVLLIDKTQLHPALLLHKVLSSALMAKSAAKHSIPKQLIKDEGVYLDKDPPNEALQALADSGYYLPQELLEVLRRTYGEQALPNARLLPEGAQFTPFLKTGSHLIWTDVLGSDYVEYMKAMLVVYDRLLPVYQTQRNESHYQKDLYDKVFDLARLHKRNGISGNQKLVLLPAIIDKKLATSVARKRFTDGLKPDIADGWLVKHSVEEDGITWRLLGPDERFVTNLPAPAQIGAFGDDRFLGMDLLVELKKEDHDVDKYKVWLEALGSLLCFQALNKTLCQPIVFCGTCSQLDVRFYAMDVADTNDKNRFSKPPSEAKKNTGEIVERAASPDDVKFIVRELFATSVDNIDSFLQFAMFLWRLKQFRWAQYNRLIRSIGSVGEDNYQQQRLFQGVANQPGVGQLQPQIAYTNLPNTNSTTNNTNAPRNVNSSFAQLDFTPLKYLNRNSSFEIWQGQVNGVDAFLKANIGLKDVWNEISIYKHLQDKRFVHMPTMLGSYTCEDFDVIVVDKVEGEHIERVSTKEDAVMYAFKLLKVLEQLHNCNVAHGDIRPSNVVYKRGSYGPQDLSNIKLIDFGFAHLFGDCNTCAIPRGYSYGYSSREVAYDDSLTVKDDIYSAGIIIGELICGYGVQNFKAHTDITTKIQQGEMPYGDENLGLLVLQMLASHDERPSASQLLQHAAFKHLLGASDDDIMLLGN